MSAFIITALFHFKISKWNFTMKPTIAIKEPPVLYMLWKYYIKSGTVGHAMISSLKLKHATTFFELSTCSGVRR